MGWFATGFDAVDKIPELKRQTRFWLKAGEEKRVIFLDEEPFCFWEHQVTLNGSFNNYFTCLKNLNKPCPLCEAGIKRYFVGLFSIIELTEWVDKEGKKHSNPVKVMAIKQKALKLIKRHSEKGRIKNGLFTILRSDAKSGNSGDYFEFEEAVDPLEYNPNAVVFDYEDVCKPFEADKLRTIAGMAEPDEFSGSTTPTSSFKEPVESDDVPF